MTTETLMPPDSGIVLLDYLLLRNSNGERPVAFLKYREKCSGSVNLSSFAIWQIDWLLFKSFFFISSILKRSISFLIVRWRNFLNSLSSCLRDKLVASTTSTTWIGWWKWLRIKIIAAAISSFVIARISVDRLSIISIGETWMILLLLLFFIPIKSL